MILGIQEAGILSAEIQREYREVMIMIIPPASVCILLYGSAGCVPLQRLRHIFDTCIPYTLIRQSTGQNNNKNKIIVVVESGLYTTWKNSYT